MDGSGCETVVKIRAGATALTVSYQVNRGVQPLAASRIWFVGMIYSHSFMAPELDF